MARWDNKAPTIETAPAGATSPVKDRRRERLSPRIALARAAFEAATTPDLRRRLMRKRGLAVVVKVPSAGWVAPLRDIVYGRVNGDCEVFARDGSESSKHLPHIGSETAALALAAGKSVIGVSQTPDRLLPSALIAAADIAIVIVPPTPAVLARAMTLSLRGRVPKNLPPHLGAGLDFNELVAAFRANGSVADTIARLQAGAHKHVEHPADALPALEDAIHYGAARQWGLDLAADIESVRRGDIDWSAVDRGAVFFGPPGTGKTWLARLIARACRLPIIESSVAELFATSAGYLDSVVKAQRSLFARAAAAAPCILFLDEIDAMPSRAKLSPRGRDWWTPVINDFLLLLANTSNGTITLGATNRLNDVDEAVLRPGRLERAIEVLPPSTADGLASILRFHLSQELKHELKDVDLVALAHMGLGASAATAMSWVRQARRRARRERRALTRDDLMAAIAPPDDRSPRKLRASALHEAGHAVVALALGFGTIDFVSIVRRDKAGGGCRMAFERLRTRAAIEARAMVGLAGRAAEIVALGRPGAGAGGAADSDLALATRALCALHGSLGLGETLAYRTDPDSAAELLHRDERFRAQIESDLVRLHAGAEVILRANRPALAAITDALLARRHLDGAEVARLFVAAGGRPAHEAVLATPPARILEHDAADESCASAAPAGERP